MAFVIRCQANVSKKLQPSCSACWGIQKPVKLTSANMLLFPLLRQQLPF